MSDSIEIVPGLRTKLGVIGGTVVLRVDVECAGLINSVYLDEDAMWRLAEAVKNAIDAAASRRIPRDEKRKLYARRRVT